MKRAQQKKTVQSTVYEGASFNFFKKEMIMELVADELEAEGAMGEDRPERKKDQQTKKKGGKGRAKEEKDTKGKNEANKAVVAETTLNGANHEPIESGKTPNKEEQEAVE